MEARLAALAPGLLHTPLLWLTLTLLVFQGAEALFRRSGAHPLSNPVLLSVAAISALLLACHIEYQVYFSGARFLHFLLGPATVALAVPLYRQMEIIRKSFAAIMVSLLDGSLTGMGSALALGWLCRADPRIILSMAPKSVTTPIAMGIAGEIGGLPSLTAVIVIVTGISGAAFGGWALDRARVKDPVARGLAYGTASHGIGTARAMHASPVSGAFAGLAMGLNGLATALILPALVSLLHIGALK